MIEVHLLTATGRLASLADALLSVVATTGERVCDALGIVDPVDLVVRDGARAVIPEVGLRGTAPNTHEVYVSLDPLGFDGTGHQFARVLAHELHHVARRRAGATGATLLDAFVHEGLADHFVDELVGGEPSPWCRALDPTAHDVAWARALEELDSTSFDRRAWMFGAPEKGLQKWTGYSVGYNLLAAYLKANSGVTAASLAAAHSQLFRPPG